MSNTNLYQARTCVFCSAKPRPHAGQFFTVGDVNRCHANEHGDNVVEDGLIEAGLIVCPKCIDRPISELLARAEIFSVKGAA